MLSHYDQPTPIAGGFVGTAHARNHMLRDAVWLEPTKVRRTRVLIFAHSDLSGYSVFEEAFSQGHVYGTALALFAQLPSKP